VKYCFINETICPSFVGFGFFLDFTNLLFTEKNKRLFYNFFQFVSPEFLQIVYISKIFPKCQHHSTDNSNTILLKIYHYSKNSIDNKFFETNGNIYVINPKYFQQNTVENA
jgi:hypothetical protein